MFVNTKPTLPRLDTVIAEETPEFQDRLEFQFELSSSTQPKPIVVNGHNIVRFSVELKSSGFVGEVAFAIRDDSEFRSTEKDQLLPLFRTQALLKIKLGIRPQHTQEAGLPNTIPFVELNGLSTEKSVAERMARHLSGGQISYRLYHLRFADPAQVLWRQHYPLALYTQTSLQSVITQNLNQYIQVTFTDKTLSQVKPLIFLGCNVKNRVTERASFYDFLMWQLDETERIWNYDYKTKRYQILKTKTKPVAINIVADDLQDVFTYYPAPQRDSEALLNDYTEAVQNRPVKPLDATVTRNLVPGVRQDFLWNTPLQSDFEAQLLEHNREFKLPQPEFVMSYRLFPSLPYAPGAGIDLSQKANQTEFASAAMAIPQEAKREICRVFALHIAGRTLEDDVEPKNDGKSPVGCSLRISVWLETASNPARRVPPYILPKYPVHIEGKVLGEVGRPIEETYQFYPDPKTHLQFYKIVIPLWKNQVIKVPYNPNMDPGHFYFPAYKNERVLIALHYDEAYLKRFLDWRPTAQLPLETQGDHLLLGKTPVNRTSVRHIYENERPVFEIERLNMQQSFDTELVRLSEGCMILSVGTPLGAPPPGVPVMSAQPAPPGGNNRGGG